MYISYSLTTAMRCRCKYCGTEPSSAYYQPGKMSFADPTSYMAFKSYVYKMRGVIIDFYSEEEPKTFTSVNCFSSKINFNKTGIKYRQYYKVSDKLEMNNMILLCDCMKTSWLISISERDHIKNRKSIKVYPFTIQSY